MPCSDVAGKTMQIYTQQGCFPGRSGVSLFAAFLESWVICGSFVSCFRATVRHNIFLIFQSEFIAYSLRDAYSTGGLQLETVTSTSREEHGSRSGENQTEASSSKVRIWISTVGVQILSRKTMHAPLGAGTISFKNKLTVFIHFYS